MSSGHRFSQTSGLISVLRGLRQQGALAHSPCGKQSYAGFRHIDPSKDSHSCSSKGADAEGKVSRGGEAGGSWFRLQTALRVSCIEKQLR